MAVNFDESNFFKFVIISDKPKPSKNNFTEKPSKDKDNMSANSSSPPPTPNNETLDEKKQKSQETNKQTVPEVKVSDTPNNNGDSINEQKNEEKSSRLTIEVPSKSTSPQLVTSPSEIKEAKTPEPSISPISPPQNSNIFKNVSKKLGNMIRNSSDNDTVSPDQEEVATSNSKVQMQQEQQIVDNNVANNKITENTMDAARSDDENQKEDEDEDKKVTPETAAVKQRSRSLSSLANMKLFITRTSSVLVEKLKEEFDNLDRRIYPDIDPDWDENQNQDREAVISEREQLLENKDVEITNGTSQKSQSTQNIMAEVGVALNERGEKLDSLGERTEKLNDTSLGFYEAALQLSKNQEQKNNEFWKFWQ